MTSLELPSGTFFIMESSPTDQAEAIAEQTLIAIQGEAGSFHEIAARQWFGDEVGLVCCDSFPELFKNLRNRNAEFAVMAIENSVAGTILKNYKLLRESDFSIIGEVYLRISHMLMALPGTTLEELTEIHSHPMAISQCHRYLDQLSHVRLLECDDTAASARRVAEQQLTGVAAIASSLAATQYGLEILQPEIEDDPHNYTRFFILAKKPSAPSQPIDKASLCFSLGHEVGSLSQILVVLGAHGMNLSKIQSSPVVGKAWEYFFHLDLEFGDYSQYQRALESIKPLVSELRVIGEYPKVNKTPEA